MPNRIAPWALFILFFASAMVASALQPAAAQGLVLEGDQERLSFMGPNGNTLYAAREPDIAYNPDADEYLAVWRGSDDAGALDHNEFEIFAVRIDAATGEPIDSVPATPGVVEPIRLSFMGPDGDVTFQAQHPAVAYNPDAQEYLVVWSGEDDTAPLVEGEIEIFGIRVQIDPGGGGLLDGAGGGIGPLDARRLTFAGENGVTAYSARQPDVTYSPDTGEYLVVWVGNDDSGALAAGENEIWGLRVEIDTPINRRLLDGNGGLLDGGDMTRLSFMGSDGNTAFIVFDPQLAYNPDDQEFVVVWRGEDNTGALVNNEFEAYGLRVENAPLGTGLVDGAGNAVDKSDMTRLSFMGPDGDTDYQVNDPSIAYSTASGEFLVTWVGEDNTAPLVEGEREVFGLRVQNDGGGSGLLDGAGAAVGKLDAIRLSFMGPNGDTAYGAFSSKVAYNPNTDEFLVLWHGEDNTPPLVDDELEVFALRVQAGAGTSLVDGSGGLIENGDKFQVSFMGPDGDLNYFAFNQSVAYNSAAEEFMVIWRGEDDSGALVDGESEIFGRRLGLPEPDAAVNVAAMELVPGPGATGPALVGGPIEVGDPVQWTVTVTNIGVADASSVVVRLFLPDPADFTVGTATPSLGGYDAGSGTWSFGPLAMGDSETLSIIGTVNTEGGQTLTAVLQSVEPSDSETTNDVDSLSINVGPDPTTDLAVTLDPELTTLVVGEFTEMGVEVANNGGQPVANAEVAITIPAGFALDGAVGQGSFAGGVWSTGPIAAGASAGHFFDLEAVSVPGAPEDFVADITGASSPLANTGDDMAAQTLTVIANNDVIISDGPTAMPNPVASEGMTTLSVTADDDLGRVLEHLWSANCPGLSGDGSFDDETLSTPTWTAPMNDTGLDSECTISVSITYGDELEMGGMMGLAGPMAKVDTASTAVTVEPDPASLEADFSIALTATGPVVVGEAVDFTATITNNGTSDLDDGDLFVTLAPDPAVFDIDMASISASAGGYDGNSWTILTTALGVGDSETLSFTATALTATPGEMVTADLSTTIRTPPANDPDAGNDSDAVSVEVIAENTLTVISGPGGTPNPVAGGTPVALSIEVEDLLDRTLYYDWSASCPDGIANGTFVDGTTAMPTWVAPVHQLPDHGICTLSVTVSDTPPAAPTISGTQVSPDPTSIEETYQTRIFVETVPDLVGTPNVLAGVIPGGGTAAVGSPVTFFAILLNPSDATVTNCRLEKPAGFDGMVRYRVLDDQLQLLGNRNEPVDVPPGGMTQSLVGVVIANSATAPANLPIGFVCDNATAGVEPGLNTFLFAADTPAPTYVLMANPEVRLTIDRNGSGTLIARALSLGPPTTVRVRPVMEVLDAGQPLPLTLTVCEKPADSCLAPPTASLEVDMAANPSRRFEVQVQGQGQPLDGNVFTDKIFLLVEDLDGTPRAFVTWVITAE